MKKVYVFAIFVSLVFLPYLSAVQINMNSNFSQGETLTAEIFGNFMNPLQPQNILLYQGHIRVSFIPSVTSHDGIYYLYGQLGGKSPGNYSLVLSGISYMESGKIKTADVLKNFTISNKTADFSISPGFAKAEEGKKFYATIQNLGGNIIPLNASLSETSSGNPFSGSENSTQILPGQYKKIYLSVSNINKSTLYASFSSTNTAYTIPVFISPSGTSIVSEPSYSFSAEPSDINVQLPTNSRTTRYIHINNTGNLTENISAKISESLRPYLSMPNDSILLPPNSSGKFQVNIISKDNNSLTSGFVQLQSENFTRLINFLLNFSQGYIPPEVNGSSGSSPPLFQNCAQLGGILCNGSSTCNGPVKSAQDGPCCLGTCQPAAVQDNTGKIIGWSLVGIIVVLLALFLFKRYSKAKKHPITFPGFLKKK